MSAIESIRSVSNYEGLYYVTGRTVSSCCILAVCTCVAAVQDCFQTEHSCWYACSTLYGFGSGHFLTSPVVRRIRRAPGPDAIQVLII